MGMLWKFSCPGILSQRDCCSLWCLQIGMQKMMQQLMGYTKQWLMTCMIFSKTVWMFRLELLRCVYPQNGCCYLFNIFHHSYPVSFAGRSGLHIATRSTLQLLAAKETGRGFVRHSIYQAVSVRAVFATYALPLYLDSIVPFFFNKPPLYIVILVRNWYIVFWDAQTYLGMVECDTNWSCTLLDWNCTITIQSYMVPTSGHPWVWHAYYHQTRPYAQLQPGFWGWPMCEWVVRTLWSESFPRAKVASTTWFCSWSVWQLVWRKSQNTSSEVLWQEEIQIQNESCLIIFLYTRPLSIWT